MEFELGIALLAFVVGALVGFTGVGAGAIMTPVLVAIFGVPMQVAIATDLIFATVTKIFGAVPHHQNGSIDWRLATSLWMGSIPGTVAGVAIVVFVVSRSATEWLLWPLAAIVLFTAFSLAKSALAPGGRPGTLIETGIDRHNRTLAGLGGFGIGSAVAMTSVGAGVLGMALLVRLSPSGTSPNTLVGTDLVHAVPIALIAGVIYGSTGLLDPSLLINLLAGSIPGVVLGSLLNFRAPARLLKLILAGILVIAISLVFFK